MEVKTSDRATAGTPFCAAVATEVCPLTCVHEDHAKLIFYLAVLSRAESTTMCGQADVHAANIYGPEDQVPGFASDKQTKAMLAKLSKLLDKGNASLSDEKGSLLLYGNMNAPRGNIVYSSLGSLVASTRCRNSIISASSIL